MMPLVTIPDDIASILAVALVLLVCGAVFVAFHMGREENFPEEGWERRLGPPIPPSLEAATIVRDGDVLLVRVPRTEVNAYLSEATDKREPLVLEFPIECIEEEGYGGADRD